MNNTNIETDTDTESVEGYQRPEITKQDLISASPELLQKHLKNYVEIHPDNYEDISPGTMIRYILRKEKKFRLGGSLIKNAAPEYFVLKNPFNDVIWSVNLSNCVIFMKDKKNSRQKMIEKNNLYRLYEAGYVKILDEPDPDFFIDKEEEL